MEIDEAERQPMVAANRQQGRPPSNDGGTLTNGTGEATDDGAVFAALYPRLMRFAAAVAPGDMEPDDLAHDALANTLRGGPITRLDNPEAYLRRTIVNLVSNHRRRAGIGRAVLSTLTNGAERFVTEHYPSETAALLALTPLDRAILYLVDVEAMSYGEVGTLLGVRTSTARGRASRARKYLRTYVHTMMNEGGTYESR